MTHDLDATEDPRMLFYRRIHTALLQRRRELVLAQFQQAFDGMARRLEECLAAILPYAEALRAVATHPSPPRLNRRSARHWRPR